VGDRLRADQVRFCGTRIKRGRVLEPCNRVAHIEIEGYWYCGLHDPRQLAERAAERARAVTAQAEARRQEQAAIAAHAQDLTRRLQAGRLPGHEGGYTRTLLLTFEEAERLLKELGR
jgi:hypothetical protein